MRLRLALTAAALGLLLPSLTWGQSSVIVRKPDNTAAVDVANTANQTAPQAVAGSDAAKAVAVQGITGGKAVKTDGSAVTQPISAAALPLPAGAATSAAQTTAQTSLGSIDTKLSSQATAANQATGNTSLSSIDGKVATAAKQDTGNTSLGSIDTKLSSQATAANQASQITQETAVNTVLGLQADAAWTGTGSGTVVAIDKYVAAKVEASRALLAGTLTVQFASPQAVTQSGTWNVTNISGTVSLPTGASTAANQATGNTSLGSIDTKLSSQATAANQTSQITQETAVNTALGLQADTAWTGTGSGTLLAIEKYVAAKAEASRALLAGTLTVQFPSAQAVTQSGTWNLTNISGTVSLPTGAATAAKQPALGVAGTASSDVLTVQGIASMTALKVDGSAVTQPVSAASLPLPSGAATSANQSTANTTLSTIATNTTGAATAANQTSANTKLDQLHTDMIAATPAGTNIIGKVGIDQTTPGTTNGVVVNSSALPTGASTSANQTAQQANAGSDATKAVAVQGVTGMKPVQTAGATPAFTASGTSSVTGTFGATGQSSSFSPAAGRNFNITLTGTFVATVQLERSFDAGSTWVPLTLAGTQLYSWTSTASEQAGESETSVVYRLNCTAYTSGTVTYRLSQ